LLIYGGTVAVNCSICTVVEWPTSLQYNTLDLTGERTKLGSLHA